MCQTITTELMNIDRLSGTTDLSMSLIAIYNFSENVNVNFLLRYTLLDQNIGDSPIVEKENISMVMSTITYKFN